MIHLHVAPVGAGDPGMLSGEERARAARFLRPEAHRRYVFARSWLRRVLAQEMGCQPADVDLRTTERGKPVAPDGPCFNLSHSGDTAIIAVADRPVGVDGEEVTPGRWDHAMAALVLSPEELSHVDTAPPHRRDLAFFSCWTRKEAWAKLTGSGLTDELRTVSLLEGSVPGTPVRLRTLEWRDASLVVSLAAAGDDWDVVVRGGPAQPARLRRA